MVGHALCSQIQLQLRYGFSSNYNSYEEESEMQNAQLFFEKLLYMASFTLGSHIPP